MPSWIRRLSFLTVLACFFAPEHASAIVQYSTNFKPFTTNQTYASCIDFFTGAPIPGAQLSITMNWVSNTNSHLHPNTSGHPNSSISPSSGTTGSNGSMPVTIYTTLIGQDEYAQSSCVKSGYTTRVTQAYFTVGYADIYYNNHPEIWVNVGGTSNHGGTDYNRYMTTYAAYQIYYTTYDYLNLYGLQGQKIAANDQSLPYGGTFDLNANWTFPHAYHYRGTAADIRGNTAANNVPVSRQADFINFCRLRGADLYQIEYATAGDTDTSVADSRRHIHCHWPLIP